MSECALCQLAATPIDKRETKTFFWAEAGQWWSELGRIEVVRDTNLDGACDRLLCYATKHAPAILCATDDPEYLENAGVQITVIQMMGTILHGIANREWGEHQWDEEVTMQSCPRHGWHSHARKKG